jgi:hypothetical protein
MERGLRHNKGEYTESATKELESASSTVAIPSGFHYDVRLEPSKAATFRILD